MSQETQSSPMIVVRHASGEREVAGGAALNSRGELVLPSAADAVCEFGHSAGQLRLTLRGTPLRVNGIAVERECLLNLHDTLRLPHADVVVDRLTPEAARLSAYPLDGNDTAPAALPGTLQLLGVPDDTPIVPAKGLRFDLVDSRAARRRGPRVWWRTAAALAALALAAASVALSQLERVEVVLAPADARVTAPQSWFSWHSAASVFVFPGTHRLRAEREGYEPASGEVTVREGAVARLELRLAKLPGLVSFDTSGVAADVSVDGVRAGKVPGELSIAAGPRTITLRAPRYLDQVVRLDVVGMGQKQSAQVSMQPSFGVVNVQSVPAGAVITIDGENRGVTPADVELQAGVRRVVIAADGMRPWQSTLVVRAGEKSTLGPIELGAADAIVTVRSSPSGADVTVGGSFRGKTPLTTELAPGVEHSIVVSLAGYDAARRSVFAEAAGRPALDVRLVPQLVSVRVAGEPTDAEVWVNGVLRGKTPSAFSLPATRYRLEVRKSGFEPFATELTLAPGLERSVEYRLVDPKDIAGNAARSIQTKSGIELRLVRGGEFRMGSDRREQGRRPNEGSRRVTLSRPYYLGATEVTNAQFRKFRPLHNSGFVAQKSLDLDGQAVTGVSWNDAVEFCNWLSAEEGLAPAYEKQGEIWLLKTPVSNGYRLPTEAEWEFAARATEDGKTRRYAWGDALPVPGDSGNFAGAEAAEIVGGVLQGYRDPQLVVSKPREFSANPLGLYDMAGNVSEWVTDWYSSFAASGTAVDPLGPAEGKLRGIRGSSWRSGDVAELRFAWRDSARQAADHIGFRVARYVAP
jgi:formylglycine-generating enzyme required for sulfatase activity